MDPNGNPDCDIFSNFWEQAYQTHPVDPPPIVSSPTYQIVERGGSANFSVAVHPDFQGHGMTYQWYINDSPVVGATSTSYVRQNVGASDSTAMIKVVVSNTHTHRTRRARLVAPDSAGWQTWLGHLARVPTSTDRLWSVLEHPSPGVVGTIAWDTQGILWGRTSLTAISPCHEFSTDYGPAEGQKRVTALTRRHGYAAGHPFQVYPYDGSTSAFNGKKVWFLNANQQLYSATIANTWIRNTSVNGKFQDYTIFVFSADLPADIEHMRVTPAPLYGAYVLLYRACQHGNVSANQPPFSWSWDSSFPPLNHNTFVGGDSGSPNMFLNQNELLFIEGTTSTAPSSTMQATMDWLSASVGAPAYQMEWVSLY